MDGEILSNEGILQDAASAFSGSSTKMSEASGVLKTANDALVSAWTGIGSDRFLILKDAAEAYCLKMTEIAAVEAKNIASVNDSFYAADQGISTQITNAGQ